MKTDTSAKISKTDAEQDFAKVMKLADEKGQVVIFENNTPRYLLTNIDESPIIEMSDDEKIEFVARRILKKHLKAFQRLAEL